MKIDFNVELINPLTEAPFEFEMKEGQKVKKYNPTLKTVAVESLSVLMTGEEMLSGLEKFKRGQLAVKINNAKEPLEVSVEEVALIKDITGKLYPPVTMAAIWGLLESLESPNKGPTLVEGTSGK